MKDEPAQGRLQDAIHRLARDWWLTRLAHVERGTKIRITSCCYPGQEPFVEEGTFDYVDSNHVYITHEPKGGRSGLPSCFIIKVEVSTTWREL